MSVTEIAQGLTELCRAGHYDDAVAKYYGESIVSVEAMGPNPISEGLPAIQGKMQWWMENFEMHEMFVDGPFVNENTGTFAVEFTMDATMKATGQRRKNREVAVYTVKDGKIVHEQFIAYVG
jgi:ketosteroid isomerase-like protein